MVAVADVGGVDGDVELKAYDDLKDDSDDDDDTAAAAAAAGTTKATVATAKGAAAPVAAAAGAQVSIVWSTLQCRVLSYLFSVIICILQVMMLFCR